MSLAHQSSIPKQGQIVTVRQRRYVVSDVRPSALPPGVLYQSQTEPQHLVSLSSIEDDALGETLQVIKELNLDALRRWLQAIPGEIGQEQAAFHKCYADPQLCMVPVVVAFLVP